MERTPLIVAFHIVILDSAFEVQIFDVHDAKTRNNL